jgi:hypothetical protein
MGAAQRIGGVQFDDDGPLDQQAGCRFSNDNAS